jgi:hypothetical protein
VVTQTATVSDPWENYLCFGPTPTTVKVDQLNEPQVRTDAIKGTTQLNVGVILVYTFTDQFGNPVEGLVTETVVATQGRKVTQTTDPVPLIGGKVMDLVSNPVGVVPTTQAQQLHAISDLNKPFVTGQQNTITVIPDGGAPPLTIIHERNLNNTTPGAPPLAGGLIKGYTFTMDKPKIPN